MVATRLQRDDLGELARLLGDPRVAKMLTPTGRPLDEREVLAGLDEKLHHWEDFGFGMWLLRDRSTGEFVGRGGLQHTWATGEAEVEAGWAIVPDADQPTPPATGFARVRVRISQQTRCAAGRLAT